MLVFIDETFRKFQTRQGETVDFGALCGVGIPISDYAKIANAVFKLKLQCGGREYAEQCEIKGKELISPRIFRLLETEPSKVEKKIEFVKGILNILAVNKLTVFGCVCFDQRFYKFTSANDTALANTFKSLSERINMFMKREHHDKKAVIVFDNRDTGTNERNARAMTNYFVRSRNGNNMRSSILEVPLFAISQANNIGLELADLVTTIIGLYAAGEPGVMDIYNILHKRIYTWKDNMGRKMSTLRWLDPQRLSGNR